MDTQNIQIVLPLVVFIAWMWNRLNKKFDKVDQRFSDVMQELKGLRNDFFSMQVQFGKLETRVEERTLRIVHVEKTGMEKLQE